ncbi:MAG TPA: TatD family hydrolase [Candidatus Paceibacterota bacterium]|jgi:TatD DNase family protein|nr:TatD family hydrolase [Candidatus Paceibacterota bacterium]
MDFKLFDSHCHLYMEEFSGDRDAVLARMQEQKIGAVLIGADLKTSKQALELAQQHDFLWAAVGLHPNDNPSEVFDAAVYEQLARDPKVVAVGECGLEYRSSADEERNNQILRFEMQIALAQKVRKPLVVHCRDPRKKDPLTKSAHDDMLALLAECKPTVPVVIHFFTGTAELAQKYLDLGCYLSFPGPVTYTDMYDESIQITPMDRMLIETDAPFAAPVPNRGRRNEPAYVADVARKIAVLKGLAFEDVAAQTAKNASSVFSL